ncbi:hypothetical protein HYDPIDRAFT_44393 [Hydnomerulius pinastri MD-312]|uniref:Unplaced genomic scaffold scaffold_84, whole genome shotgun sequence n=1 Tax=Hydnomerulius pinastri MD-312 TaxID=994086 RepID=A0A0C9V0B0_9AGAM|nr:hypothetical protein HYDPIDRAFT_44393 [Hydnomerulius pinastri MD-312]
MHAAVTPLRINICAYKAFFGSGSTTDIRVISHAHDQMCVVFFAYAVAEAQEPSITNDLVNAGVLKRIKRDEEWEIEEYYFSVASEFMFNLAELFLRIPMSIHLFDEPFPGVLSTHSLIDPAQRLIIFVIFVELGDVPSRLVVHTPSSSSGTGAVVLGFMSRGGLVRIVGRALSAAKSYKA